MSMDEFYILLNQKFGILPPEKYDQDWEWTAGKWEQTSDYIVFYHEYFHRLDDYQKYYLINMILQGFEDMCVDANPTDIKQLWSRIKAILVEQRQLHMETIKYWSCLDQSIEDAFYCTKYMRELL